MAEIPNKLNTTMQSYIPGEIGHSGATQVQAMMLESSDEKNNVYGRAFERNEDVDELVSTVKEFEGGVFAGIMISPKQGPGTRATDDGEAYVPNGEVSRFIRIGDSVAVALDAAGENNEVGAQVYAKTDGSLTTSESGANPIPAIVQWHKPADEGPEGKVLALISLQGQFVAAQEPDNGDNGD